MLRRRLSAVERCEASAVESKIEFLHSPLSGAQA